MSSTTVSLMSAIFPWEAMVASTSSAHSTSHS
jgi:hypothetical protein